MTLVLDLPTDLEAELRQTAEAQGVGIEVVIVEVLRKNRANPASAEIERKLAAMNELFALGDRLIGDAGPLADDAVARSYSDYHDAKASD